MKEIFSLEKKRNLTVQSIVNMTCKFFSIFKLMLHFTLTVRVLSRYQDDEHFFNCGHFVTYFLNYYQYHKVLFFLT
jgi:hypothetical protein